MKISSATIDCWRQVTGPNGYAQYNDFQHHHWEIGSSGAIGTALGNKLTYTWVLNCNGSDTSNGSWSAINQSNTYMDGAQVKIDTTKNPSVVVLTQTSTAVNNLPATGANPHSVTELSWPTDLTWDPLHAVPGTLTWRDTGQPGYQLTFGPNVWVPQGPGVPPLGTASVLLPSSYSLVPGGVPGIGGRDYSAQQNWQKLAGSLDLAWWSWTINLIA